MGTNHPPDARSKTEGSEPSREHTRNESTRTETADEQREGTGKGGDSIRLEVFRYDPDIEEKADPRFDDFRVPAKRGMTVLDALIYARDHFNSNLTFRHSCRMGMCGSDGFFINGQQRLTTGSPQNCN